MVLVVQALTLKSNRPGFKSHRETFSRRPNLNEFFFFISISDSDYIKLEEFPTCQTFIPAKMSPSLILIENHFSAKPRTANKSSKMKPTTTSIAPGPSCHGYRRFNSDDSGLSCSSSLTSEVTLEDSGIFESEDSTQNLGQRKNGKNYIKKHC